jgi:hypothetical protein
MFRSFTHSFHSFCFTFASERFIFYFFIFDRLHQPYLLSFAILSLLSPLLTSYYFFVRIYSCQLGSVRSVLFFFSFFNHFRSISLRHFLTLSFAFFSSSFLSFPRSFAAIYFHVRLFFFCYTFYVVVNVVI